LTLPSPFLATAECPEVELPSLPFNSSTTGLTSTEKLKKKNNKKKKRIFIELLFELFEYYYIWKVGSNVLL